MQTLSKDARKKKQDLLGAVLLLVSFVAAAGLGFSYWLERSVYQGIDRSTMCPENGPDGLSVILIDATDPITPVQRASLHNYFERIVGNVPERSAVEVFTVDRVGSELLHRNGGRVCNPGRTANFLTQNPTLVEKHWREIFWQPLQKWEAGALSKAPSEESPILESLQSIAVTEFQGALMRGKPRTLIIASDMLQHTRELSQYQELEPFEQFSKTDYYRSVRTDWTGVNIEIFYLTRPGTPQGQRHINFWQKYFAATGGKVSRVTSL